MSKGGDQQLQTIENLPSLDPASDAYLNQVLRPQAQQAAAVALGFSPEANPWAPILPKEVGGHQPPAPPPPEPPIIAGPDTVVPGPPPLVEEFPRIPPGPQSEAEKRAMAAGTTAKATSGGGGFDFSNLIPANVDPSTVSPLNLRQLEIDAAGRQIGLNPDPAIASQYLDLVERFGQPHGTVPTGVIRAAQVDPLLRERLLAAQPSAAGTLQAIGDAPFTGQGFDLGFPSSAPNVVAFDGRASVMGEGDDPDVIDVGGDEGGAGGGYGPTGGDPDAPDYYGGGGGGTNVDTSGGYVPPDGSFFTGPQGLSIADQIAPFMNPYISDVVGAARGEFDYLRDRARLQAAQGATSAGAFGGDRHGVSEGVRLGALDRAQASTVADLMMRGHEAALSRGLPYAENQRLLEQERLQEPLFRQTQALNFLMGGLGPVGVGNTQQVSQPTNRGAGFAGGALSGAGIGSTFGPWGAGIGGALGGLLGLL